MFLNNNFHFFFILVSHLGCYLLINFDWTYCKTIQRRLNLLYCIQKVQLGYFFLIYVQVSIKLGIDESAN